MSYSRDDRVIPVAQVADYESYQPFGEPDPPRSGLWRSCLLLGGLACLMGVLLTIGAVFALYRWLQPAESITLTPAEKKSARIQQLEVCRGAFTEPHDPSNHPDYDSISQFVQTAGQVLDGSSNFSLGMVIDFDRYAQELRKYPEIGTLRYLGNTILSAQLQGVLVGPYQFDRYQIFKIENLSEDERIVYLHTTLSEDFSDPYCWWLKRSEDGWLMYDWQAVADTRYRDTESSVSMIAASDPSQEYSLNRYRKIITQLTLLESEYETDDNPIYRQLITEFASLDLPDELVAATRYFAACRWRLLKEFDQALEILHALEKRDEMPPAVYRLIGSIFFETNRHQQAIEYFKKYIDQMGADSETLSALALCHQELGETEEEIQALRTWLTFHSSQPSFRLLRFLQIVDDQQFAQTLPIITQRPDADEWFQWFAKTFGNQIFLQEKLKSLSDYLTQEHPDSANLLLVSSHLAFQQGEPIKGSKLLKRYTESQEFPDWTDFWQTVEKHTTLETAIALFDSKEQALDQMWEMHDDYGHSFELDQLLSIIEKQLQDHPDSYALHDLAGRIYAYIDYDELAVQHLQRALELFDQQPTIDDSEIFNADLSRSMLRRSLTQLKRFEEAKTFVDSTDREAMVEFAVESNSINGLKTIVNQMTSEDDAYYFSQGELARMEKDFLRAKQAFTKELKIREEQDTENPWNYGAWRVRNKLIEVCFESGDPLDAFRLDPSRDTFSNLFYQLREARYWEAMEELLQMAQRTVENQTDEELAYQISIRRQDFLRDQQRFSELADEFSRLLENSDPSLEDLPYYQLTLGFRAAVIAGDLQLAQKISDKFTENYDDYELATLLAWIENRFSDFLELHPKLPDYEKEYFLYDPLAPPATSEQLEQIFAKTPRSLDRSNPNSFFEAIWLQETQPSPEQILAALDSLGINDLKVTQIQNTLPEHRTWLASGDQTEILIRSFPWTTSQQTKKTLGMLGQAPIKARWGMRVAVSSLSSETNWNLTHQLGEQLWLNDYLGILWESHWLEGPEGHRQLQPILEKTLTTRQALKESRRYDSDLREQLLFLDRQVLAQTQLETSLYGAWTNHQTDLQQGKNSRLLLTVLADPDWAVEILQVEAEELTLNLFSGVTFVGKLQEDSLALKSLAPGVRVKTDLSRILGFERKVEDQVMESQTAFILARE